MQQTCNLQLSKAIEELGVHRAAREKDFKDLLSKRACGITATQLVEDINGGQSVSALAPCRKFRRPATAMAAATEQDYAAKRH
eukprot:13076254-Alexandrium_andersonii.AAC.1